MTIKFVDSQWKRQFQDAMRRVRREVRVVSPFLQKRALQEALGNKRPILRVITRYSLREFYEEVSDINALEYLLELGAQVRGVRNLHSKVYLFDSNWAIVTSANFTNAALTSNLEYGIVGGDEHLINAVSAYFDKLWDCAGQDLTVTQIRVWRDQIERAKNRQGHRASEPRLPDFGVSVLDISGQIEQQVFVKFFGDSHRRADKGTSVLDEIRWSGCHWACTYPRNRRPREVKSGDLLYMGRMVSPNDILIYGRAIGRSYIEGRDDASRSDIQRRSWKRKWPHYIRVTDPVFIKGRLTDGISLNELMEQLGPDSFASTQRHALSGSGNTDPRRAYRQRPAVKLSTKAAVWIDVKFAERLATCGRMTAADLSDLDLAPILRPITEK